MPTWIARHRCPAATSMPATPVWVPDTRLGAWFLSTWVWHEYVVKAAVEDLLRLLGPRRCAYPVVLDVGCGSGTAIPLLDTIFQPDVLVALDPDHQMVEKAARRVTSCQARVDFKVGCAAPLEVPTTSVDLIFCHQTFHHLPDPESAAREFFRALKPGGVLLFAESCAPFIRSLPIRLLFRHPMHAQRTAQQYLDLLRSTGFNVADSQVSLPYPWWSRPDLGLSEWLGHPFPFRHTDTILNLAAVKMAPPSTPPDASTAMAGPPRQA